MDSQAEEVSKVYNRNGVFLVTGATGLVGREVTAGLLARGAQVKAMSRTATRAGLPAGAHPVAADLENPDGWDDALRGVAAVFLYPRGRTAEFLARAARLGVRRVVTLSSATVSVIRQYPNPVADQHAAVESAVAASGLSWVHIRPATFAANTLAWAAAARRGGEVRLAYPEARYPAVHETDIAAVARASLLDPAADGVVYQVTGPAQVSRRQQAEAIAQATGRPLRIREIDHDRALRELLDDDVPAGLATTVMAHMARSVTDPDPVTGTVREVTGRPALTYAQWVRDHLGAFLPQPTTAPSPGLLPS
jgi:uncharacterized protein YbjT (DUF2867 family)